jgi:hypothetical protein
MDRSRPRLRCLFLISSKASDPYRVILRHFSRKVVCSIQHGFPNTLNFVQRLTGAAHVPQSKFLFLIISILALPAFASATQAQVHPCDAPEYRQFDFWIGDWEVQNPKGNVVGSNKVTREQDGCVLVEHWTSSRGGNTGTSFNYYDIRDKKWHQLYLSNSGNAGAFPAMAGQLKDGKMVLISDETATPVFRWTWYVISPGHVRQMAERSSDGQKTWKTIWDSIYVDGRHAAKP